MVPTIFMAVISLALHHTNAQITCGTQASAYQPNLSAKTRIIGGTEAKPHSWPWLLFLTVDLGNGYMSFCGSSLLQVGDNTEESDMVLTAAHCVTDEKSQSTTPTVISPVTKFNVLAGAHRRKEDEDGTVTRAADTVEFLSGFKFTPTTGAVNDLAIIKLASPIPFSDTIRPVCLPAQGDPIPSALTCVAAGWGRNESGATTVPEALQQLVIPVQTATTCKSSWGSTYKEDMMICAGTLLGTSATCQGDSGGQLACKGSDGSWSVYGATSFGISGCVAKNRPPIFARVSNYVDWVNDRVNALSSLVNPGGGEEDPGWTEDDSW